MREWVVGTLGVGTQEVLRTSDTESVTVSVEYIRAVEHKVIALVLHDPRGLDKTSFPSVRIVSQQLYAIIADQSETVPRELTPRLEIESHIMAL